MTVQSINSLILYLIIYSLTNVLVLLSILGLGSKFIYRTELQELRELKNTYKNTILSISLTIGIFSLAGMPPLSGFFSKAFMLQSALNINNFTCLIAILTSVISAAYYLKMIMLLHIQNSDISDNSILPVTHYNFDSIYSNIISFTTLFTLLFPFIFGSLFYSTIIESLSLFSDAI
jgi:NADH-ubiquinone oxidoreductase chain 2